VATTSKGAYIIKNVQIHNEQKMDRIQSKLACLSKPIKMTDNNKDTSLLHNLYIMNP
jgi:hypothetical protein